ncbi:hypothetical protein [Nocardia iowensis]|uniref:TetR family transcriptional regulator n=1 Tax=Nocardia iowensis TaxID=204891 RepID=A0ABX8S2U6_NOCIO|nr:hypothetical protein [Nocardia iowensis]QXN94186.1 hypothetical protein KV110_14645 [Nocardia iowensis]
MAITDSDLEPHAEQYDRLRNAAAHVLTVLDDPESEPDTVRAALTELHQAVRGQRGSAQTETGLPAQDPAAHLLSRLAYAGKVARPITLDEQAANFGQQLAAAQQMDEPGPSDPDRDVRLTELRAMIVGGLLQELAARLRPGAAFGPSREGEQLAAAVTELAAAVLDRTFVGRR